MTPGSRLWPESGHQKIRLFIWLQLHLSFLHLGQGAINHKYLNYLLFRNGVRESNRSTVSDLTRIGSEPGLQATSPLNKREEFINILINLSYIDLRMEGSHKNLQARKLYEIVLTNEIEVEAKQGAILSIIKMALADSSHFSFLLNQVDWFSECNLSLIPLLAKVLRAYRGTSKSAPKVVYNLLAEALSLPRINAAVVDLLVQVTGSQQDSLTFIDCLKENYPHKVCETQTHVTYMESLLELSQRIPNHRFQILEIIVQNLTAFDTEMTLGEPEAQLIQCPDDEVLALGDQCGTLEQKYDQLLSRVLHHMSGFSQQGRQILLKQIFVLFEKVMLAADNTKMIQCLVFYLAQTSPQQSSSFLTLLMVTILENYSSKLSKRKFISALQYLRSYVNKSVQLPHKNIKKILKMLVEQLKTNLDALPALEFEHINLSQFGEENIFNLYVLETILFIRWRHPSAYPSTVLPYESLLQQAQTKLHYGVFISESLLAVIQKQHAVPVPVFNTKAEKAIRTCFVEKFLAVFLPKTAKYINMQPIHGLRRRRPNWPVDDSTEIIGHGSFKKICSVITTGGQTPVSREEIEV